MVSHSEMANKILTLLADVVLSTVPAYKASELFGHFDESSYQSI